MRQISIDDSNSEYTDDNAGLVAQSPLTDAAGNESDAKTFDDYTQKVS